MNAKTARSQFIGGCKPGGCPEDTFIRSPGRFVNGNLVDYHVRVNLEIGEIDVSALDIPDPKLDSMGALGIGGDWHHGTGADHRQLPFITRRANACAICPSPRTSWCDQPLKQLAKSVQQTTREMHMTHLSFFPREC
jgi:hypothetical protein